MRSAGSGLVLQNELVSAGDIDDYLAQLDQSKGDTLQALRELIQKLIPEAEQCISRGAPAFRMHGKVIGGFAAFKNHLAYLPHSGSVFGELGDDVAEYVTTTSSQSSAAAEQVGRCAFQSTSHCPSHW